MGATLGALIVVGRRISLGSLLVVRNELGSIDTPRGIIRTVWRLVLLTLAGFLVAFVSQGKDPFNDREFLILFNALLIGVLAIVFFSLTEASREDGGRFRNGILLALSILTLVVNGIALSAILYRTMSMGVTPNRLAVTGANLLMFANMACIAYDLWASMRGEGRRSPDRSIAAFLPLYGAWTAIVVFVFPLVFGYT